MVNSNVESTAKAERNIRKITIKGEDLDQENDFSLEVDLDGIADDFELSEAVAKYNLGEWGYTFVVLERLVGKESYERIKEDCRLDNGRVSSEKVDRLCTEIMNRLNLKN